MNDKKTDLRVIKTRATIKRTFLEIIKKKPIEKISVTEIANAALINKGTFYLHYQDLYSLYEDVIRDTINDFCDSITFYDEFFTNPKNFTTKFIKQLEKGDFEKEFPYIKPTQTKVPIPNIVMEELKKRIYAQNVIKPSVRSDIQLDYILLSLFPIANRYGKEHFNETVDVISQIMGSCFIK